MFLRYCSEIEVIDAQNCNYWIFDVDFKFEMNDLEKFMHTIFPRDNNTEHSPKRNRIIGSCLKGTHMWNIFRYISIGEECQ